MKSKFFSKELMKLKEAKEIVHDPIKLEAFLSKSEIDPKEIRLLNVIGNQTAAYGEVFRGVCRSIEVAIKIPKKIELTLEDIRIFTKEVDIMSKMFSPNIALFMGACAEDFELTLESTNETVKGRIMIVSELLKGDLEGLVLEKNNPNCQISLFQRMAMARDVSAGMAWLHGGNPQIIHRDLKLSNLLWDGHSYIPSTNDSSFFEMDFAEHGGEYIIKICDFGLSAIKPKYTEDLSDKKGTMPGTKLMLAPEILSGEPFNEKGDIYSFGLILWQLLTRRPVFEEYEDFRTFKKAICEDNIRPLLPLDTPQPLHDLITQCWAQKPSMRPSFTTILEKMNEILVFCAIPFCEMGRQFWFQHFPSTTVVAYDDFEGDFFNKFLCSVFPTPQHRAVAKECLKAILATKDREGKSTVKLENFGKILGWFGPLGTTPGQQTHFFDLIVRTLSSGFFYGHMTTEDATQKLTKSSPGTYILRFSNSTKYPNSFCITKVNRQNKIVHIRVLHENPSQYSLVDGHQWTSLEALVHDTGVMHLTHPFPNPKDFKNSICSGTPFSHIFSLHQSESVGHENLGYQDVDEDAQFYGQKKTFPVIDPGQLAGAQEQEAKHPPTLPSVNNNNRHFPSPPIVAGPTAFMSVCPQGKLLHFQAQQGAKKSCCLTNLPFLQNDRLSGVFLNTLGVCVFTQKGSFHCSSDLQKWAPFDLPHNTQKLASSETLLIAITSTDIYALSSRVKDLAGFSINNPQPLQWHRIYSLATVLYTAETIVDIKVGSAHFLILTSLGQVLSFGKHSLGALGREVSGQSLDNNPQSQFRVPLTQSIVKIATSLNSSYALTSTNDVIVWGANLYQQLGLPSKKTVPMPTVLRHSIPEIEHIYAGGWHSLVQSKSGELYGFGYNRYYQLGRLSATNRDFCVPSPTKIAKFWQEGEKLESVACCCYYTIFLTDAGNIYAVGESEHNLFHSNDLVQSPISIGNPFQQ